MKRTILFLLLGVLFAGCSVDDDFKNLKTTVHTSLPFGNFTLTDVELFELTALGEGGISVGNDDVISIRDNIDISLLGEDNFNDIVDLEFTPARDDIGALLASGTVDIPEGGVSVIYTIHLEPGQSIKELIFNSGKIRFQYNSNLVGVTCTIKEITRNGVPVTLTTGDVLELGTDVKVNPIPGTNDLTFIYEGRLNAMGGVTGTAVAEIDFEDIVVESIDGYFGRKEITSSSADIVLDNGVQEFLESTEEVYLSNPAVNILINNSYDIPACLKITSLSVNGQEIPLKADAYNVSRYLVQKGEQTIRLDNSITATGKGFSEAVTKNTRELYVEFEVILNPTDDDLKSEAGVAPVNASNFYNRNSRMSSEVCFDIPIYGYFKNIQYTDDFEFNISLDGSEFHHSQFVITGTNGFPLDIEIGMYMEEPQTKELLLLNKQPLVIASTKENLRPDDPAYAPTVLGNDNYLLIELDPDVLNRLEDAKNLIFKIEGSTMNIGEKQEVRFYSGTKLDLHLMWGANVTLDID
ncbi:MAG TPA: hypothetical protein IAA79_01725 [Candidatus Avirikenella pullistercoris]|nr:hypothetical protein [Candidatus Avirikenella pullistercoris]